MQLLAGEVGDVAGGGEAAPSRSEADCAAAGSAAEVVPEVAIRAPRRPRLKTTRMAIASLYRRVLVCLISTPGSSFVAALLLNVVIAMGLEGGASGKPTNRLPS